MLNVHWFKCNASNGTDWCGFETLNLDTVTEDGAYIIWHAGNPGHTVYVGQGAVKDRLAKHRNDRRILACKQKGKLYVTWATVSGGQQDGVERYLADWLDPLVGDAHPDAVPIQVNSPWS